MFLAACGVLSEVSSFSIGTPGSDLRSRERSTQFGSSQSRSLSFGARSQQRTTELHGVRSFLANIFSKDETISEDAAATNIELSLAVPPEISADASKRASKKKPTESCSLCIVGGGVSGLTAAITASNASKKSSDDKIVLLEASETLGGRVQSDKTEDGYTLDRGFAVFIEEYPFSKEVLDYDALRLGKFLPGALVKVKGSDTLARVADPLRQPESIVDAILAPVGSLIDKIALLPLIFAVRTKTVSALFDEAETDTLDALVNKWGFSNVILERFFRPFLEGIYLAPIEEQSS